MTSDNVTYEEDFSSPAERVIESVILSTIIIIAVTGNVSIWIIVLKSKRLHNVTNMFMLGLSAADLLVSFVNMPVTVVSIKMRSWPLTESACVVFGYTNMLTLVTSVLSLCNISINRYVMVCRPASFQWIYTTRNAVLMITAVFVVSVVLATPPLFGWGEYAYIPIQSFCFCDWSKHVTYAYFMITCCFGVPCGVTIVCNFFIYRAVRKSRVRLRSSQKNSLKGGVPKEKKLFSSIASTILPRDNSIHSDVSCTSDIQVKDTINESDLPHDNQLHHVNWKEVIQVLPDNDVQESDTDTKSIDNTVNITPTTCTSTFSASPKRKKRKTLRRSEELRLAMCLILVVICFILCWMPYCISMLLSIYCEGCLPRGFHMFTLLIGYANSGCNPIIYGLMNKRYASGFRDLFCWFRRGQGGISMSGFSSTSQDTCK